MTGIWNECVCMFAVCAGKLFIRKMYFGYMCLPDRKTIKKKTKLPLLKFHAKIGIISEIV